MKTLNQQQLAELFGATVPTIRRWWGTGVLPSPVKTPAGYRWRDEDIDAWFEANRIEITTSEGVSK
jgi:predicted DNA-binding transcriptional regulator AlpA